MAGKGGGHAVRQGVDAGDREPIPLRRQRPGHVLIDRLQLEREMADGLRKDCGRRRRQGPATDGQVAILGHEFSRGLDVDQPLPGFGLRHGDSRPLRPLGHRDRRGVVLPLSDERPRG